MDTARTTTDLSPDVEADARAVMDSLTSGKPLNPEVARRVHERAQRIREEIFQQHGFLDLGVPLIRELRGELPEPMKYVIDSSVALQWVVREVDSDKADRLRDDFRKAVHELLAPDIFPVEVGHALTRAERQRRLPVATAVPLLTDVLTRPPAFHPSLPHLLRACTISSQVRIGVYDCLYVALAEQEGCEIVTADTRLLANFQARFPFIVPLSSQP